MEKEKREVEVIGGGEIWEDFGVTVVKIHYMKCSKN